MTHVESLNRQSLIKIPFHTPLIMGDELEYIKDAMNRKHLKGDGYYTEKCSALLQNKLGCKRALLTTSCTAALELAALLLNLNDGDEVIMPSFTFVSTANAFVLRKAKPVFVDIRDDTFNIDERRIIGAITRKTKAICVVHYGGVPCNMNVIKDIANEHNLKIIEDAAQSFGSFYNEQPIGKTGDLVCFSFHETKNIISGEGGALIINDPALIERAEIIREKGTNRTQFVRGKNAQYTWVDIGSSYLPSELISAFLYAQLLNMDSIQQNRQKLFKEYQALLLPFLPDDIKTQRIPSHVKTNGHLFGLLFSNIQKRIHFMEYMSRSGVQTAFHFIPLHSSPSGMKFTRSAGTMKITDQIASGWVRLPLYSALQNSEIAYVSNSCKEYFNPKAT